MWSTKLTRVYQVGKLLLTRSYTTIKRLISQLKFALLASRLTLDLIMNLGLRSQNNYIQKGLSRRIVSHASLRMLNFLASVMREFCQEIDRKNRIFDRKTDILRKCVARCAILLNIYGKKDCLDVSSYKLGS